MNRLEVISKNLLVFYRKADTSSNVTYSYYYKMK